MKDHNGKGIFKLGFGLMRLPKLADRSIDVEQVKEFPKDAIGRWLFPDKEDVQVEDKASCHKIFR